MGSSEFLPRAEPARSAGLKIFCGSTFSCILLAELLVGRIMRFKKSVLGAGAAAPKAEAEACALAVPGRLLPWSDNVDRWRRRVRSVDLLLAGAVWAWVAAADGGRRACASSRSEPPCLATQDAVGATTVPRSSTGLVASFGSGLTNGLWGIGAIGARGLGAVGSTAGGGRVLGLSIVVEGFLAWSAARRGDGKGEGVFEREPEDAGTVRLFLGAARAGAAAAPGFDWPVVLLGCLGSGFAAGFSFFGASLGATLSLAAGSFAGTGFVCLGSAFGACAAAAGGAATLAGTSAFGTGPGAGTGAGTVAGTAAGTGAGAGAGAGGGAGAATGAGAGAGAGAAAGAGAGVGAGTGAGVALPPFRSPGFALAETVVL